MSNQHTFGRARWGIFLVLLASLGLRLLLLQKTALDYDEGHWLMFAALANAGHPPYTETFVGIPPLALAIIRLAQAWFGTALWLRLPMMLLSLMGVAAIYGLARRQARFFPLTAGLVAALILSFHPKYFEQSLSIMAEVPAVSLAVLSVALADAARRRQSAGWAALSGAAFAASLLLKLFVVFLPLVIGLQLLDAAAGKRFSLRRIRWSRLFALGLAWLAGLLLPLLVVSLIYPPAEMYRQVVAFRFALRDVRLPQWSITQNLVLLWADFWQNYLWLTGGAALGLILAARRDFRRVWLWPVWLAAALVLLLSHVPLRERYSVMLLPPLAALTGIGVSHALALLQPAAGRAGRALPAAVTIGIAALLLAGPISALAQPPGQHSFDARYPARLSAVDFVTRVTPPDGCIITDDQRFAFLTHRLVPPFLSETSTARLDVGWLTAGQILQQAQTRNCAALVFISDRFDEFVPDLQAKAEDFYALRLVFAESAATRKTLVFAAPQNSPNPPQTPLNVRFAGGITLRGVDVAAQPWRAGQPVSLSTYWQVQQPPAADYKIFVHLLDPQGQVVAALDHYPYQTTPADLLLTSGVSARYRAGHTIDEFPNYPARGLLPTRLWLPGDTLKETFSAALPAGTPPGTYQLSVGLYNEAGGDPLPVIGGEMAVIPVEVAAP